MNPINRLQFFFICTFFFSVASVSHAQPITLVWKEDPIPVELPVKQEQRIDFPDVIAYLDVPKELQSISDIQLSGTGVLHLKVNKKISPVRVYATSATGSVYMIDVSASPDANKKHITIIDPSVPLNQQSQQDELPAFLKKQTSSTSRPVDYVTLSQFALAHHIGPQHLIPEIENANKVNLKKVNLSQFHRFNHHLEITPLQQWQVGQLYVTTLHVHNQGNIPYQFDARGLRGSFLFISTAALALKEDDETVWAIVSNKPFSIAVQTGDES